MTSEQKIKITYNKKHNRYICNLGPDSNGNNRIWRIFPEGLFIQIDCLDKKSPAYLSMQNRPYAFKVLVENGLQKEGKTFAITQEGIRNLKNDNLRGVLQHVFWVPNSHIQNLNEWVFWVLMGIHYQISNSCNDTSLASKIKYLSYYHSIKYGLSKIANIYDDPIDTLIDQFIKGLPITIIGTDGTIKVDTTNGILISQTNVLNITSVTIPRTVIT